MRSPHALVRSAGGEGIRRDAPSEGTSPKSIPVPIESSTAKNPDESSSAGQTLNSRGSDRWDGDHRTRFQAMSGQVIK
jgi:hypothetical protein